MKKPDAIVFGVMVTISLVATVPAVGAAAVQWAGPEWRNADLEEIDAGIEAAKTLERLVRESVAPTWIAYEVEAVRAGAGVCCHGGRRAHGGGEGVCLLEDDHGISLHDDADEGEGGPPVSPRVRILLRAEDGRLEKVAVLSAGCLADAGGRRVLLVRGVDGAASLELLGGMLDASLPELAQSLVMAVALHAGSRANGLLGDWARGRRGEVREAAIFWLGAARRRQGLPLLAELLEDSPQPHVREKVVFGVYVSEQPESVDLLIGAARGDRSPAVREQAVFWLAQLAGERAVGAIEGAAKRDPELEVRKQAVFALSQLPPERGLPLLIRIARTHDEPEIRKQAIFWIGQSDDARALEFIEELLRHPAGGR